MKILFIPHLPTLFGRRYFISKYLVKSGHEVHFITWDMPFPFTVKNILYNLKNSWKKELFEKDGIIIHKIKRFPFLMPFINKPLFKKQIRELYNNNNIDIIITQSSMNEVEQPLDLPYIYDINDDHYAYAAVYGSLRHLFSYKILGVKKTVLNQTKNAKAVIVVSDILMKEARKYNKNVFKITNGVEPDFFSKNIVKYSFGKHSLAYVSFFGEWSKLPEIIDCVNNLKPKYPDIKLILVGNGPEIPNAKKKVEEYKLENNIVFLGWIENRKKIIKIINSVEVCLNISEKNVFRDAASPIKYFEYSALGKKIISSNLAEVEALKFPNTLIYMEKDGIKGLEKLIIKSFKNKADINKTRDILKNYSWPNIIKEIEKICNKVVNEHKNK